MVGNQTGHRLADDFDRHFHVHLFIGLHQQQIHVHNLALYRVTLNVLDQDHRRVFQSLQGNNGIRVVLHQQESVVVGQQQVHRIGAVPVENCRNLVGDPSAASKALTKIRALFDLQSGVISHVLYPPKYVISLCFPGRTAEFCCGLTFPKSRCSPHG